MEECNFSLIIISKNYRTSLAEIDYPTEMKRKIGDALLLIKVASAPLEEEMRGINIYSNGVCMKQRFVEVKDEMSQYIYGEIDAAT